MRCLRAFRLFDFSTFSGHAAHHHSFLTFDSFFLIPPVAASYALLDPPKPLFTSVLNVVVASIAVAESQDVSYAPLPVPYSSNQRPTKRASGGCYWSMWYAMRWISYWAMVCAMRWRIGDEGIAFLFLLRACCHDIAAAMALVVAEPAPGPMPGRYRAERSYLLLRTALYLFFSYLSIYIFINYTLYFIYKLFIHRLIIIVYLIL